MPRMKRRRFTCISWFSYVKCKLIVVTYFDNNNDNGNDNNNNRKNNDADADDGGGNVVMLHSFSFKSSTNGDRTPFGSTVAHPYVTDIRLLLLIAPQ